MGRRVVIVGAVRTPIGSFQGSLSALSVPQLGAVVIRSALQRASVEASSVDEVMMGCVLQAGVGQAPARQASIWAGLSETVPTVTINKVCGSGLKAVLSAAQAISQGDAEVIVAGGMESMSNAPYLSHQMRTGARMGDVKFQDAMILDGLLDVYGQVHMGVCAEECASNFGISRPEQDAFALESTRRAQHAQREGLFREEIIEVSVPQKKGEPVLVSEDEGPKTARPGKIPGLKPVFKKDGTVTAGNASSLNDGAAALVLMTEERATAGAHKILGRIAGYAEAARKPSEFTIAPADAINRLLKKVNRSASEVDLWEINEAFAVVSIANNRLLNLDASKVNDWGGRGQLGASVGGFRGARIGYLTARDEDFGQTSGRCVPLHWGRGGHRADG